MSQFKAPLLQPFIRRLRFESFLNALFTALAGGLIASLVALLVMWLLRVRIWSVVIGVFAGVTLLIGIIAYFVIYRFSLKEIIRRVDEAGLQERVTTMEELWGDNSYIARLQRQDTLRRIKELKPRAIRLQLPLIAAVVLLAISVTTVGAAITPPIQGRVRTDDPIADDYKIIIPAINNLSDKLYQAVEQLPETLPETVRDELNDIIKDIEDLNDSIMNGTATGGMDSIADLDEKLDRLDQILEDHVKSPLLSDYMKNYTAFRALANALKTAKAQEIHDALYSWSFSYADQLTEIASGVSKSDATPAVREQLSASLTALIAKTVNTANSFGDDRKEINKVARLLAEEMVAFVYSDTCIEVLLGTQPTLKSLSDAMLAGDTEAVHDALNTIEEGLFIPDTDVDTDEEVVARRVNKTEVDALITALDAVMQATSDRPNGDTIIEDSAWVAIQNLYGKLEQVSVLAGEAEIDASLRLTESFIFARAQFEDAVTVNKRDIEIYNGVVRKLDYVYSGRYLYAYLWNDPASEHYISDMGQGLAAALRQILDKDCRFSIYTDAPLVQALYKLLDGLEVAAENAMLNDGDHNAMYDLYGMTREHDAEDEEAVHERHPEQNTIPVACNEITDAMTAEKEIQDVIEDMKDQIQDAIDDLLDPDQEEKDDTDSDTGIDAPPSETPPSGGTPPEGGEDESDQDSSQENENQNPSTGGSSTGKEDLKGMTFFNPNTGEVEELTEERLAEFKAALDKAMEDGNYSPEEEAQMDRYYKYLLEKFSKN